MQRKLPMKAGRSRRNVGQNATQLVVKLYVRVVYVKGTEKRLTTWEVTGREVWHVYQLGSFLVRQIDGVSPSVLRALRHLF